jgi:hypothetical protein
MAGEHLRIGETIPPPVAMLFDEHREHLRVKPLEYAVALIPAAPAVPRPQHHMGASDFAHPGSDFIKAVVHLFRRLSVIYFYDSHNKKIYPRREMQKYAYFQHNMHKISFVTQM